MRVAPLGFRSSLVRHRDRRLIDLIRDGVSAAEAGRVMGISRERACQVWRRETGLSVPRKIVGPRLPVDREVNLTRRFWSRVRVAESGCWMWVGAMYPTGYGCARERQRQHGGYAHRVAYEYVKGPIPTGLTLDHLCRVRACVNPDHLEAVTARENIMRSPFAPAAINARKTHCKRGHEFNAENTRFSKDGRARDCRVCQRENNRAAYRKRAAA